MSDKAEIQNILDSLKDQLTEIQKGKTAWERLEASKKFKDNWVQRTPQRADPPVA